MSIEAVSSTGKYVPDSLSERIINTAYEWSNANSSQARTVRQLEYAKGVDAGGTEAAQLELLGDLERCLADLLLQRLSCLVSEARGAQPSLATEDGESDGG